MNRTFLITSLVLITFSWYSCRTGIQDHSSKQAGIAFDTSRIDFGEISFSSEAECEFVFTNSGKDPLLVTHVKSTCGCTIAEWSREPVRSGEKGSIRVNYDTHRVGAFTKSIYVYSNAENGVQRLYITGMVKPSEI
ncbi:DUF1573 domain-containing protein [Bacteroidota bacterium]